MSTDRTVNLELFADISTNRLVTRDGSAFVFPTLTQADTIVASLKPMKRNENGDLREVDLPVRTINASFGKVLAPPTAGSFKLRATVAEAPTNSAAIQWNAAPEAFATAVAPLIGDVPADVSSPVAGCWLFRRSDGAEFSLAAGDDNRLEPTALPRVRVWERYTGEFWCEVRLIQTPLAWNDDGHTRELANPPSIRRIRGGSLGSEAQPPSNELQALTLPLAFRGTYFLRWNYRVSRVLGTDDGPDEIADALNGMFASGSRFEVTNPEDENAYVEFVGDLGGGPQDLIEVEVNSFRPGTLTFSMPLDFAPLHDALRTQEKITAPFEIELELGDIEAPEEPGHFITICRQNMTVEREEIWRELASVRRLDWLRPGSPINYIPFTPDQIVTGQQSYNAVFGDGAAKEYSFPHNLATFNISGLIVRENKVNGRFLTLNNEFHAEQPSGNEMVLTFATAPALHSLAVTITTAGPKSAFQAHTHTMAQVVGLIDALAAVTARVDTLEDLLPESSLARVDVTAPPQTIELPELLALYPGRLPADLDIEKIDEPDTLAELRPPPLLPAIHDATVTDISDGVLPAEMSAGNVYKNTGAGPITVPGGGGRKTAEVPNGGYIGTDGRFYYRVTRSGTTNSFFPTDMERELFLLPITAPMWRPGQRVQAAFSLEAKTVLANTRAQVRVIIEAGAVVSQSTPAPTAQNVEKLEWRATPILSEIVYLSDLEMPHYFGALIKRTLDSTLNAERLTYTAWTAAESAAAPVSPSFMLRGRLAEFDTENSVSGASGFVYFKFTDGKAGIS